MENLADRPFRRALLATVGGFDEACTEFIRVPGRTDSPLRHIRGITHWYDASELGEVPLGAQLMGSSPELLALAAEHLVWAKGAPRVDLNCGCPANAVTGNGAGSTLLRTPDRLATIVAAVVAAVGGAVPVSVKMRAGFDDTALFEDNLLAAQAGGASFVTLHPRTKRQCYQGRADWSLTARAVELLDIPVVGNGDVVSVERAHALLRTTGCNGLMVGRGAVQDPLLFLRIRHSFVAPDAYGLDRAGYGSDCNTTAAAEGSAGDCPAGDAGSSLSWRWREPEMVQDFLRAYSQNFRRELGPKGEPLHGQIGNCDGGPLLPASSLVVASGPVVVGRGAACTSVSNAAADGRSGSDLEGTAPGHTSAPSAVPVGATHGAVAARQSRRSFDSLESIKFGRLKKVIKYLFASSPQLAAACGGLLRLTPQDCSEDELVELLCRQVAVHWPVHGGPSRLVLYDHMNKTTQELRALEPGPSKVKEEDVQETGQAVKGDRSRGMRGPVIGVSGLAFERDLAVSA